jgi:hypothetical protein
MSKIGFNKFITDLKKAKTEEDVKNMYAKIFGIQYDTSDRHDLYTPQVLFEFKYEKNFEALKVRATVLAQILYYVRRLKFGGYTDKPISPILCLADQNEVIFTETILWKDFYVDAESQYDWDLAPSNPDTKLVKDLSQTDALKNIHIHKIQEIADFQIFVELLTNYLNPQFSLFVADKKVITEDNFEDIFQYWNKIFGDAVRNGLKTSRYFVTDIQVGSTFFIKDESKVIFQFSNGEAKVKKILARDYEYFWSLYERVSNADIIRAILAKIDRLSDDFMRRFHGEFFTPIPFAKKSLDYLEKTLGKHWWQSGEYRLWDMAAGTGNLEYGLPQEALPYCYLSTLYVEDIEHLQKLFVGANIFQYDYLNDDVQNVFWGENAMKFELTWKLPEKLRKDLANPKIKWIILINPPFATASAGASRGSNKTSVTETRLRKIMHKEDLGEVSRELFSQFIYRIKYEFEKKQVFLALFSTLKYINSNNDQKLRDKIFDFSFERGFIFSSANFSGTNKNNAFPIGMLIWNMSEKNKLASQEIILDVFDENVEKIGTKQFTAIHKTHFLSKWVKRPPAKHKFPPLGSALVVKSNNKDRRDRISDNFIGSLMAGRNDFQNQNIVYFLSAPAVNAGAYSMTPENFEKSMIIHAVQRIPKATWLNDRDQFLQPNAELSQEFTRDCIIWNLFSNSNQTASLRNVIYEGITYQIRNHFFPFPVAEVKQWKIADADIRMTLATAEDSFIANYVKNKQLSTEANVILAKGKEIYELYFASLGQLATTKFKIQSYDAGWYQIRNAMADVYIGQELFEELKVLHNRLKDKLLPQIEVYGFI